MSRGGFKGAGSGTSFTQDQMSAMNITRDMNTSNISGPPPIFPTLSKPVPLESNPDRDYKILWKEDFMSYLRESPYYFQTVKVTDPKTQTYSQKLVNALENAPHARDKGEFPWHMMPAELRPNFKRIKTEQKLISRKKIKVEDVEEKFKILEKKEIETAEIKEEAVSDTDDEDKEEQEAPDEEMDDENDYGNNYFDNGESYNDDDDGDNEGPIY